MSDSQPRDENGHFVDIKADEIQMLNEQKTIGVCKDEHVTPAVDYLNVDVDLLNEAINKAQDIDGVIRIGILRREYESDDKTVEEGIVLLKGKPSNKEVITQAGFARGWNDERQ